MSKLLVALVALSLLLAACSGLAPIASPTAPAGAAAEAQVRAVVEGFGVSLQQVSLLASDAADQIRTQYAPYAAPDLLELWAADPQAAPGRLTSSPWPDRIEIAAFIPQGDGYLVDAVVVEMTSAGESGRYAVILTVDQVAGAWLITAYTQGDYQ